MPILLHFQSPFWVDFDFVHLLFSAKGFSTFLAPPKETVWEMGLDPFLGLFIGQVIVFSGAGGAFALFDVLLGGVAFDFGNAACIGVLVGDGFPPSSLEVSVLLEGPRFSSWVGVGDLGGRLKMYKCFSTVL